MMPGPDQVVACPLCQGLARYRTLLSGNTIGARVWTDGRRIAPMLPRPPAVVKCGHCQGCYWLAEAREVGQLGVLRGEQGATPAEWRQAEHVVEPTAEEYYLAIGKGLAKDREQERRLRVLAWWRSNDAARHGQAEGEPATGARRDNLVALASLLNEEDDNDRMMKAEVLRELGEFTAARVLLDRPLPADYAGAVALLRQLCDHGDAGVRERRR